ncbi:MAG TPA: efflux RND transporter periplasmic adaptor subunit [Sphingomonas sp.]
MSIDDEKSAGPVHPGDLALENAGETDPQSADAHRFAALRQHSRTIGITAAVLAAILAGLFLWRMVKNNQVTGWQQQDVAVTAVVATPRDVPAGLDAVGTLAAVREVTLAPEVAGRIAAIRFNPGAYVRAGTVLVQLYDGPERADRAAAQAKANFARLQLARSQELAPSGAEPRELLEQRRAEYAQAMAEVRQIDARLIQKQVRAPFSGQLGIRKVNLGQYVNPGDAIASLAALDQVYVNFALPQQDIAQIRVGSPVVMTSDAYPDRTFTAQVSSIDPQIGDDTRNVMVQATMANPGGLLRPGMYVSASLSLPAQPGAIVLPATAIQTSAEGDSVIVIRGKNDRSSGKAEVVPVKTGRRVGDLVVIDSGLKGGEVVVAEGQLRVQPGAPVKVAKLGQVEVR